MELESKETENNNKEVCEEHVGLVLNFVSMLQVMFATQYSFLHFCSIQSIFHNVGVLPA